jgi:hypothetical protein
MSFGGDPWGDFHPPGGSDDLTGYLAGLIDIDQSKNHRFIRQPATAAGNNVPGAGTVPNQPIDINHRRFYPDLNAAPGDVLTPSGFNLTNPLGGDPVEENATGLLLRYTAYMSEVVGFDGIRIDAIKHSPTWYFNNLWDGVIANKGRRRLDGTTTTPFSFGESFTGDVGALMAYHNRAGANNRTVLDFAHYFTINSVFNAGGLGNLEDAIRSSIDYADDGNGFNGSAGVFFIASHDKDGGGGSNIGNFWIALRKGHGIIYHNAGEFPPVTVNGQVIDFPKAAGSRGDAIGAFPPDNLGRISLIADMADIRRRFAHGNWRERWMNPDYLVLEYEGRLVYALNDRGNEGVVSQSVTTAFPQGTVLVELTGNAVRHNTRTNSSAIPTQITVGANGSVPLVIPNNIAQFGYVAYGPRTPSLSWEMTNVAQVLPPDGTDVPVARRRLTPIRRVTSPNSTLTVTTDGTERAVLVNIGDRDLNGSGAPDLGRGGLAGFEFMPAPVGNTRAMTIDWAALGDGFHYVEIVAPIGGGGGQHGLVWSSERFVVQVDLERPNGFIRTPFTSSITGPADVLIQAFTDGTEDNALINLSSSFVENRPVEQFVQMRAVGPNEWLSTVSATLANRTVTVRLYEDTGLFRDIVYMIPGPGDPTPTPTPSPTPTGTPTPTPTPTPTVTPTPVPIYTVDGVQSNSEPYLAAANSAPGIDTNTRFGFADAAKAERVASFLAPDRLLVFVEGSLHSNNRLYVLIDGDKDAGTGWRGRHPEGFYSESVALRHFSAVFDGGWELGFSVSCDGGNPPTTLFVTMLAYNPDGTLASETFLGDVPLSGGLLQAIANGQPGGMLSALTPGDGTNHGVEIAIPRQWLPSPANGWRIGVLANNGANSFWSNSTIPQNSLPDNIGFTSGVNEGVLAGLTAPTFDAPVTFGDSWMIR